jgi:hypothetical protein
LLKIFFEITITVIEYKIEFFVCRDYFFEVDDVWMFEDFEERDLPDGCGGKSLVFMIKTYFFEGNNFVGLLVSGFVDDTISALTDFVNALKLVVFGMSG